MAQPTTITTAPINLGIDISLFLECAPTTDSKQRAACVAHWIQVHRDLGT